MLTVRGTLVGLWFIALEGDVGITFLTRSFSTVESRSVATERCEPTWLNCAGLHILEAVGDDFDTLDGTVVPGTTGDMLALCIEVGCRGGSNIEPTGGSTLLPVNDITSCNSMLAGGW